MGGDGGWLNGAASPVLRLPAAATKEPSRLKQRRGRLAEHAPGRRGYKLRHFAHLGQHELRGLLCQVGPQGGSPRKHADQIFHPMAFLLVIDHDIASPAKPPPTITIRCEV